MKCLSLLHADFYSETLGRGAHMDVVLPDGPAPEEGFATLFLLHGMTDDCTIWQRRTSIERYADERRMAVVMPGTDLCWYANTAAGENYFDFIADELPRACRRMLPGLTRLRERSFVAGLSMGGYGALRCALKRPDVFSRVASLSGAVDIFWLSQDPMPLGRPFCWEDVFGPREEIPGSEHDLFRAAEQLKENRPEIWMWCGTEDDLYDMNVRMRDHLRRLGYALAYSEGPGDHQWKYWDREIQNVLNWLAPGEEAQTCR